MNSQSVLGWICVSDYTNWEIYLSKWVYIHISRLQYSFSLSKFLPNFLDCWARSIRTVEMEFKFKPPKKQRPVMIHWWFFSVLISLISMCTACHYRFLLKEQTCSNWPFFLVRPSGPSLAKAYLKIIGFNLLKVNKYI